MNCLEVQYSAQGDPRLLSEPEPYTVTMFGWAVPIVFPAEDQTETGHPVYMTDLITLIEHFKQVSAGSPREGGYLFLYGDGSKRFVSLKELSRASEAEWQLRKLYRGSDLNSGSHFPL